MSVLPLYANFSRLGIFLVAFYIYFLIDPVLGSIVAGTGMFSFVFRSRFYLLLSPSRSASYWELAMTLLVLANAFILAMGWYGSSPFAWVDIPMHVVGGLFVAWWGALAYEKELKTTSPFKQFVFLLAVAAFLGTAWEMFEWTFDHTLGAWYALPQAQASINDTMEDLLNDILGGAIVEIALLFKKKRE